MRWHVSANTSVARAKRSMTCLVPTTTHALRPPTVVYRDGIEVTWRKNSSFYLLFRGVSTGISPKKNVSCRIVSDFGCIPKAFGRYVCMYGWVLILAIVAAVVAGGSTTASPFVDPPSRCSCFCSCAYSFLPCGIASVQCNGCWYRGLAG